MNKLRVGIIGVGGRGICNATAVNAREDVELVGICDLRQERLDLCDEQGLAGRRFLNYHDLLAEDLEAVFINTDNNVHAEQTLAAAERGLHIYCEKPIALNVADARAMFEATRNVATVVNLSMRAIPEHQYLRAQLAEGRWGKLLCVGAVHPKPSGLLCRGMGHKATLAPATWGPILMHDGVHISEWLRFMGGEVESVVARTKTTGPDPSNEEFIHAITEHAAGVMGSLSYMAMPFLAMQQYVICEEATIWPSRDAEGACLRVGRIGADDERIPVPARDLSGDDYFVDEFLRAIREGHRPYATMEDGYEGQRIVEAIRRSGQTEQAVALADVGAA
jgi:UDP-N-acetylglucosamine 3-dehydrogenase